MVICKKGSKKKHLLSSFWTKKYSLFFNIPEEHGFTECFTVVIRQFLPPQLKFKFSHKMYVNEHFPLLDGIKVYMFENKNNIEVKPKFTGQVVAIAKMMSALLTDIFLYYNINVYNRRWFAKMHKETVLIFRFLSKEVFAGI